MISSHRREGLKTPEFEPAALDEPCPNCDATTQLRYEEAHLVWMCTECEGNGGFDETFSNGVLYFATFAPTGLVNRTPDEILDVGFTNATHADLKMNEGICPSCAGPVEAEFLVCDDLLNGESAWVVVEKTSLRIGTGLSTFPDFVDDDMPELVISLLATLGTFK